MSTPLTIRRYALADAEAWNGFVAGSSNGTFLHDRRFMDYHADRFEDYSLVVEGGGQIIALLPANRDGTTLQSHGGLTYSGLITGSAMSAALMLELISALHDILRHAGFTKLYYKAIPHIFHRFPAEADIYALHQVGARLAQCDLSSAIAIGRSPKFSKSKRQGTNRAVKAGLTVFESDDYGTFWEMLTARLSDAHGAAPTHSLGEINFLRGYFPDRIRLYTAQSGDTAQGGLVVFDCDRVVHVQYMATSVEGRENGSIDLIVSHLLEQVYPDRAWFNFGVSTTEGGRKLNSGLARQKEMFGARSVLFNQYEWDLT